tara:strand:+ start:4043 stop:5239 length:1197 start_codon:yes stop_codon:yes gene_type:complete
MKSFLAGIAALFMVAPAAADYLSESGRAEVEALKAAYRGSPTTPASYPERAAIAWRWLNAFAMTGASIPVNMTTAIRPNLPDGPRQGNARSLDYYLEELILLDEEPAALGQLEADKGPFEARSYAEVRQRWTVGSRGVTKGGGFLVARHFMPGYGVFQTDAPAKANYVSIRADREGVSFVADGRPLAGMHGGFRGARPALFFRLSAGELQPGDVVTVTYGDQGGGGPGLQMGPASTDFLPLPIYVDFDGGGHSFALPIQPVAVRGTALAGVHAFAPSVVRRGESFEISVRAQDRFITVPPDRSRRSSCAPTACLSARSPRGPTPLTSCGRRLMNRVSTVSPSRPWMGAYAESAILCLLTRMRPASSGAIRTGTLDLLKASGLPSVSCAGLKTMRASTS